ncbi:MAG: hypothetical protein U9R52_03740 [Candidatus Omnitrophota bacterium]|nr:hypothetical protein [Candidatus Omnitrophota bacterium]
MSKNMENRIDALEKKIKWEIGIIVTIVIAIASAMFWAGKIDNQVNQLQKDSNKSISKFTDEFGRIQKQIDQSIQVICSPELNLKDQLDGIFRKENWFSYPDNNFKAIGVMRLPKDFVIKYPIRTVDTKRGIKGQGERTSGDCGAHVELDCPLQSTDIPLWQTDALIKWKDDRRKDTQGITSERLDVMFGKGNWHKNPKYDFSIIVSELKYDLLIEFPITSVDANNLKYGVGMDIVKAKQKATIWLAGSIH